jgi:[ribosomal protein S5]-alanine N-acetyltransferase
MILETPRLSLKPLTIEDASHIGSLLSNPEIMEHWDYSVIDEPETVAQLVEAQIAAMDQDRGFYWVSRSLEDGGFVGCCDVADIDWRHRRAEVGFALDHPRWGQGLATEAMHAVIDHMAGLGIKRLTARIHVGNTRSDALLRRLHFQEEGYLRGHVDREGERRDCRIFGLLL